nr:TIGR04211 family SH3 domain-containing protein [Succinivibrionaceae bacterium]
PQPEAAPPTAAQPAPANDHEEGNDAPAADADPSDATPRAGVAGFVPGGDIYVSDKVQVWVRSGPSSQHRVTGAMRPGDHLIFITYSPGRKYVNAESDSGKRFWIPTSQVEDHPLGHSLTDMQAEEITTLRQRLDNYDSELKSELKAATDELTTLRSENATLKKNLTEREESIRKLDEIRRDYASRLETKELDMQMRWWMQGAIIALAGALVGILFVYLPRPGSRKKQRERF